MTRTELLDLLTIDEIPPTYEYHTEAVKAAEAEQLQNIFISLAEGFKLDWGYNGKQVEISIGRATK